MGLLINFGFIQPLTFQSFCYVLSTNNSDVFRKELWISIFFLFFVERRKRILFLKNIVENQFGPKAYSFSLSLHFRACIYSSCFGDKDIEQHSQKALRHGMLLGQQLAESPDPGFCHACRLGALYGIILLQHKQTQQRAKIY